MTTRPRLGPAMLWPLVGGCWLLESPRTVTAAQEARRSGAIIVTIPHLKPSCCASENVETAIIAPG